jgi:hypothetical protein
MMKRSLILLAFAATALTAGASFASSPSARQKAAGARTESKEKSKDSERPVKMKNLPPAVRQTVREQSRGAKIRGLSIETEKGVTNYEVELRVNGHARDVLIDPSGAVVSVEEEVALASLPEVVRAGIERSAAGGGVVEVYEAHVKRAGKTLEIKVGPDGQLIPEGQE